MNTSGKKGEESRKFKRLLGDKVKVKVKNGILLHIYLYRPRCGIQSGIFAKALVKEKANCVLEGHLEELGKNAMSPRV